MSEEKVRACWCSLDGTSACELCERKVYYQDGESDKVLFFEADEEDYYPV